MKIKTIHIGGVSAKIETDEEDIEFIFKADGISIRREVHKDLYISYQDLVELLDGQQLLKT